MSGPTDGQQPSGDRWIPSRETTRVEAVRIDLVKLHGYWMGLAFPRQTRTAHEVYEQSAPETTRGAVRYKLWATAGIVLLPIVYLLAVVGAATRFYSRRLDRTAASIGILGVVLVSLLVWGVFTAATYFSAISFAGFIAVAVAGVVATASAALAHRFSRRPGRYSTVLLAYPFGVTAIFLPPVVAALYSPTLAAIVFPSSESIAIWILNNLLDVGGMAVYIRTNFELEGLAYVGMWFGIAVPVGWLLGGVVTLANWLWPARRETWEEAGSLGGR